MLPTRITKYLSLVKNGLVLAAIFTVLLFGAWKLTMGPLYRTNDAASCRSKYATAKTLAETTTVDFQPYADSARKRGLRCGMTRSVTLGGIK